MSDKQMKTGVIESIDYGTPRMGNYQKMTAQAYMVVGGDKYSAWVNEYSGKYELKDSSFNLLTVGMNINFWYITNVTEKGTFYNFKTSELNILPSGSTAPVIEGYAPGSLPVDISKPLSGGSNDALVRAICLNSAIIYGKNKLPEDKLKKMTSKDFEKVAEDLFKYCKGE